MPVREVVTITKRQFKLKRHALREICASVDLSRDDIMAIARDLRDTLATTPRGAGIAAPQIGVNLRLALIQPDRDTGGPDTLLVNPTVVRRFGATKSANESCLSIPGWCGPVERKNGIEISYIGEDGASHVLIAEDFDARLINHEIDHLDGILYIDRMSNLNALVPE